MCRYIYKWEFNFWEGDCPMMMSSNNQPLLPHDTEDVIFLEGHFFIKKKAIQKNKQVVQKTKEIEISPVSFFKNRACLGRLHRKRN